MIKRISKYFRGELSEEQALKLWEKLLVSDKDWPLLNLYLLFNKRDKAAKYNINSMISQIPYL